MLMRDSGGRVSEEETEARRGRAAEEVFIFI